MSLGTLLIWRPQTSTCTQNYGTDSILIPKASTRADEDLLHLANSSFKSLCSHQPQISASNRITAHPYDKEMSQLGDNQRLLWEHITKKSTVEGRFSFSQKALGNLFGVHRHTVRAAMQLFEKNGWVRLNVVRGPTQSFLEILPTAPRKPIAIHNVYLALRASQDGIRAMLGQKNYEEQLMLESALLQLESVTKLVEAFSQSRNKKS